MPAQIKIDLRDVQRKFGLLRETLHTALRQGIAEGLFAMTRHSFETETSPEGEKWQRLSIRYAVIKAGLVRSGKPILQLRGWLLRSLYREVQGTQIEVGSHLPYAAIHNWGGLAGRGRTARIPARPFLPKPETAEREAARLAEEILQGAIDQAGAA